MTHIFSFRLRSVLFVLFQLCLLANVSAQTPSWGAFWEGNDGDHIVMDKYMATDTEDPWCYNQRTFLRIRAWNTKRTTHNCIQLFFWIEDWDEFTQNYTDGVGPKEGSWPMNLPGQSYDYYGNWCWLLRLEGNLLNKCLVGYDPMLTDVCAYSSYGADAKNMTNDYEGDWNKSDITSFSDYSVQVSVGEGGNIYIEIGSPSKLVATIGKKETQETVFINLTSNLDYEDNTEAETNPYVRLSGSGTGSDTKEYEVQLCLNWNHTTGDFTEADIDFSQSWFRHNGADIECTSVTGKITEPSEGTFKLVATLKGKDGNEYNVISTYTHCPKPEPFEGGKKSSFSVYNDDKIQIGKSAFPDPEDWYYTDKNKFWVIKAQTNSQSAEYNYVQLYFWVNTDTELYTYGDGNQGVKPGTYHFQTPRVEFLGYYYGDAVYTWYVNDQYYNNCAIGLTRDSYWGVCPASSWAATNYYNGFNPNNNSVVNMNSATIVVKEGKDGHIYIEIWVTPNGKTTPELYITINEPKREGVETYKLYISHTGDGSVTVPTSECDYAEGDRITLTPYCEDGWIFEGWSGDCTDQIEDNGDGTYTFTMGSQDCSLTANCIEEIKEYHLDIQIEGNGTVTKSPDLPSYKAGTEIIITPHGNNTFFEEWKGTHTNLITDNGDGTYSITMPAENVNLTAVFTEAKTKTDKVIICSLPFTWRPWHNGGIEITDASQNGTKDIVYKEGSTTIIDSIITLSLTLHEPQTVPVEVVDTFWQCDYDLGDGNWINIVVEDGMGNEIELDIPNAIGTTYETTEPDQYGCDSVTIHEVIIIPEKVQRLFEFCQSDLSLGNDNYINLEIDDRIVLEGSFWGTFSGDSIIRDTTLSVYCEGFDSITIDTIRIYPAYREPWNPGICADKIEEALAVGIPFYGTMITDWSQDGEEHYTDGSIHGCDSVIVLDLTPIPNDTVDEEVEIHAFPYTYKGLTFYSEEDTLFSVTPQLNGCNMYTKLIPVFADTLKTEVYEIACLEYVWNENNKTYTETGTDTVFLRSYDDKLDSIVVLHLTIDVPKIGIDTTATACSSFVWYGTEYTESGDYTKDLKSVAGCDSTVTLHLTVHKTYNTSDKQTVCRNSLPYIWEGEEFTDSGTRTKTLQTVHGCDSTVTFTLTVAEVYDNIQDEKKICGSNLPYTWEGETFNESGTITKTLQSIYGCDSTVTFTLTVMSVQDNVTTEETICSNELPYRWGEVTFTEAGTETQTFVSSVGCDSTVTLTLHVNPSYNETDGKTVCPDELPYRWQDVTFTGSGTQTRTLKTVNGCDSVVTFTLTVQTPTDDVKTDKVCDNRLPYTWNPTAGYTQNLNEAGTYSYTLKSSIGCDSIRYTLNLTVDRDYVAAQPAITAETCANDKVLQILLNTTAGEPAAFDITFDERAAAQGLANISHETIPDDHIIAVPLPHDADSTRYMRPDDYSLTLTVYDGCDRRTDYPIMFKVLYPSWLIQQRWRDVLALYNDKYNGGYTFSVIRWFKNGVEMLGQGVHNSYVQMSPVLEMATYYALLTRADDGKTIRTCDFVPNLASPYYAPETEKIRLLQQNDSRHITVKTTLSGEYRVYDVTGKEIMTGRFGEAYGNPAIVFSPACANGAYIIRFFANDGTEDTKKWLIR